MRTPPSILIACVGNIFLGDDGFGVEVAARLAGRRFPEGVRVVDFGIRGIDLAYAMLEGPDVTVLVDAMARGNAPGTLVLLEADIDVVESSESGALANAHAMDPATVLRLVHSLGGRPKRVLVVGCEPETLGLDDGGTMGLSEPVAAAVDEAVAMIESLVATLMTEVHTPPACGARST